MRLFRLVVSDQMEGAMKFLAAAAGALLAATLLIPNSAQAGASASAPSKFAQNRQPAAVHQPRQAHRNDFVINEYSSSSAKTTSPRR
jgi:hypothetical protein